MAYSETITAIFQKITRKQAFQLAVFTAILVGGYFIVPPVLTYINNSDIRAEERYFKEAELEREYQRKLDSIEELRRIEQSELFIYKNNEINDIMAYLERRFPLSSHITVYSIHNGGGVPKTGGDSELSVLYTSDNVKGVNILKEYSNMPLYAGYAEFAYQCMNARGKGFYVKNVQEFPAIYNGETKNNMDFLGTKSIYGVWIKSSPTATYYLSVAFPEVNGMMNGGYGIKEVMMLNARMKLVTLIDAQDATH